MGEGASTFESPREEIIPNPPSASGNVDSITIIIPHLKKLLFSHITHDNLLGDPLTHPSILHQQPSPLDNVAFKPQCCLGEH